MKFRTNTWHLITFDCLLLHLQCLLYAAELMQGSKTKLYLFQLQTFAICTFCVIGICWKLRGLSAILIQKAFWSKESHSVAWEAGFLNTKCMIYRSMLSILYLHRIVLFWINRCPRNFLALLIHGFGKKSVISQSTYYDVSGHCGQTLRTRHHRSR